MTIKVLHPGLSTTVQDLGRPGYFHLGIPVGGAMDRLALRAANLLVGNDEGAACLEAVFIGPQLEFTAPARIAVTGADMPIKLDGVEQPGWTALAVKAGQVLSFDYLKSGARIIIAVAGGIDVPLALGSRSTYPIGALGGFKGRAIAAGDELPVGAAASGKAGASVPEGCTGIAFCRSRNRASSPTSGRSRPRRTAWAIASAAARRCNSSSASSRSGPAPIRPTSSTAAIPMARSRCRAARSRSSCIATPSPAAAISWSAR
jgi:allophanate hydrolase subunit 2